MSDCTLPQASDPAPPPLVPPLAAEVAPMMTRGRACLLLLAAAFLWGSGNVANKTVLDDLDPLWVVVLRCALAAAILAPLALRERAAGTRVGFGLSVLPVAGLFTVALAAQQAGFAEATVTNAGFLVNTAVVLTPIVAWLALGERPGGRIALVAGMTMAGVFLMTGATLDLGTLNRGDLLCLVSAVFYAGWTVALGQHAMRHGRPFGTALAQVVLTAVLIAPAAASGGVPTGAALVRAAPEVVLLGVFATAAAFALMTAAQRHVPASTAAVIVSAESVFGMAAAIALLGEVPATLALAGGALILGAIVHAARPESPVLIYRRSVAQQ